MNWKEKSLSSDLSQISTQLSIRFIIYLLNICIENLDFKKKSYDRSTSIQLEVQIFQLNNIVQFLRRFL